MPDVQVFDDADQLFAAARDRFVAACERAIAERGRFRVALSGGSTPRGLYERLAAGAFGARSAGVWSKVDIFWGDERHVPPDHAESNYRLAHETFLSKIEIPPENVYRWEAEGPDAAAVAAAYEDTLRRVFVVAKPDVPRFDLVLLGLGPDGHTASLFPGTAAIDEVHRLAVSNRVDKLDTDRLTLTPPMLNFARQILFLVRDADKAEALAQVLGGPYRPHELPAQCVRPESGDVTWLIDRAAAGHLG